jgi:zinc protease
MEKVTTDKHHAYDIMHIPAVQPDVIRFICTCDLFSDAVISHPSLLDHYTEMLLSGTRAYSREELIEAFESLGTQLSIDCVGSSAVRIEVTTLRRNLKKTLILLRSILSEPTFKQKELTRVNKKLTQEFHEAEDDARTRAFAAFSDRLFKKTIPNYFPDVTNKLKDINSIKRSDIVQLHRLVRARRWKVSISANHSDTDAILQTLEHTHVKDAQDRIAVPASTPVSATTKYISIPSKANVELCIGNVLPYTQADAKYLPFMLGYSILAKPSGFAGRLMSTIREKEGLTYMIYGRTSGVTTHEVGSWHIDTFFTPKDLEKGIDLTKKQLAKIVKSGVTDDEMKRFKTLLHNQFLIAHESSSRMLSLYHSALAAGKTANDLHEEYRRLKTLKKSEVDIALRESIDPNRLVITGAGPI